MRRTIHPEPAPVLLLALLMAGPATGQEAGVAAGREALSLEQAVELAQRNNPDYQAQRNQIGAAEWQVRAAYGSLLPSISASNSFGYTAPGVRRFDSVILDEQPAIYSSRYQVGASLSLDGASLLAPAAARAEARATERQVEGAAATLEADVTQRYLGVLQAREAVAQAEGEVARTQEHLRLAQARFEVGAGTQLDVRRAEVQNGQALVRLLQAENTAATELLTLAQVIGTRLPDDVELTETFPLFQPEWTTDELVNLAMEANPVLRAGRANIDAARARQRAAQSAYLPTISFSAGFSGYVSQAGNTDPIFAQELQRAGGIYNNCLQQNEIRTAIGLQPSACVNPGAPAFQDELRDQIIAQNRGFPFDYVGQPANASITISLPIFTGLNRQLQVEQARVTRLNAEHQVRAQELQLETDVETALRGLQTNYRAALLQQQIRQTAEQELALAQERFRLGLATSIEIVDAQANLAEAERAEIAAVYDFHRGLAVLEATLGGELTR